VELPPGRAPAAGLAPGGVLGPYQIEREIGRGGMGVVYLAQDLRLGRKVALKAVAPSLVDDAAFRDRLRREARAAAVLAHPGIATVYALEEIDGQVLMAGEFVPGETLRDEMAHGPLGPARALDTALQLARALSAAHAAGIVHRDLKPENVVRAPAGQVKILDFGLALMRESPADAAHPTGGRFLGTPAYMSPEQIRGATVDARSDLFSLGTVLYELATGEHPFRGSDSASTIARILEAEPRAIALSESPEGPNARALHDVIRTCLQKDPDARYASADALAQAIDAGAVLPGSPPARPGAPAARAGAPRDSRWWWQFHQAAASIAYLALMAALWFARGWIGGRAGLVLFLFGLSAGLSAVILRLHLWFALRAYPAGGAPERRHVRPWLGLTDGIFVAALAVSGLALADSHPTGAIGFIGASVAALVSAVFIEPATSRAAFGGPAPSTPAPRSR
jgi:serine/threonine-protein kinase